jgi:hypothetical protein
VFLQDKLCNFRPSFLSAHRFSPSLRKLLSPIQRLFPNTQFKSVFSLRTSALAFRARLSHYGSPIFLFHFFPFYTMKLFKHSLALAAFVCGLVLASCNPEPAGGKFGFVTGDYTVYETVDIDSAGRAIGPTTRSSTTVLRTNLNIGGQNDAVEIVDTNFVPGGPPEVQRGYLRIANDELFRYIDTNFIGNIASALAPGASVQGFTPRWIKIGELKDAASTQDFPTTDIMFSATDAALGTVNIGAKFTGKNLGRSSLTANNTTYQVHRNSQTVTVSVALLGININLPVTTTYNYGIPSTGAPRTMIQSESKEISTPLFGNIPGERKTLVSFTPGK